MQTECEQENFDSVSDYYDDFEHDEVVGWEYLPQPDRSMVSSWIFSGVWLLVGSLLLVIVNNGLGPMVLAFIFLTFGLIIHLFPGFRDPYARRAFVLTFCTCVLITGLAQTYAMVFFGEVQNTTDAIKFYDVVHLGLGSMKMEEYWRGIGSPLPIVTCQAMYTLSSKIGLGDGPWIAVLLNSFLVAIAGSITIKIGRYFMGDDDRGLYRLGTLFAFCGLMWLFAAILIRDSFALIINVIVMWACVRGLCKPGLKNFMITAIVILLAIATMRYVRLGLEPIFLLFGVLAFLSWTRRTRSSVITLMLPLVGLLVGLMLMPLIAKLIGGVTESVMEAALGYGYGITVEGSLGARLIVQQPMPIRLVVGSLHLLVQPIPLWVGFRTFMGEYHWIKGWEGFFLVWVTPTAIVAFLAAIKRAFRGGPEAPPFCFIALYAMVTLTAVAVTSLETRHHGQFLPAILILAAMPNKYDPATRAKIRTAMALWFGLVVAGHITWAVLKFS